MSTTEKINDLQKELAVKLEAVSSSAYLAELESMILNHKELYYQGRPEISDEEFDELENQLSKLHPDSPVLKKVGKNLNAVTNKVPHENKMLSLDKTYSESDLDRWRGSDDILSTFKIDGSSCSLIYKEGKLVLAKTRGDGRFGEDITQKVVHIKDIPTYINSKNIEVRGEIYCTLNGLSLLSEEMKSLGLDTPSSQRNIVAGLLGRKENIELAKHLSFKAFEVISDQVFEFESQKLDFLKSLGFKTPDYAIHKSSESLQEVLSEAKGFMECGDYLIDGVVFTFNRISKHEELGETSHHPRYKMAFKFAGQTKNTKIEDIEWQVSRNGRLTPVAIVSPVELSGAMISRVTLHNYGIIKNFELKVGDVIEVIRSGEVIPKFLSVTNKSHGTFKFPSVCPSCNSTLEVDEIWLKCLNLICPSKIKEEILNYIHKTGIDDISDKRLEEMMNKGLVSTIADLYKLTADDFLTLDKVKDKLAKKMFNNIQKTKNQNLSQFISAIGIEGVSLSKAEKIILAGHNTLEKFLQIEVSDLQQVDGFAEKSSTDIANSISNKTGLIKELISSGVVVAPSMIDRREGSLRGVKICITGELTIPRNEMVRIIKSHGGEVVTSVTKVTGYLLTNETDSLSSKFKKAQELGIKVISESALKGMMS